MQRLLHSFFLKSASYPLLLLSVEFADAHTVCRFKGAKLSDTFKIFKVQVASGGGKILKNLFKN